MRSKVYFFIFWEGIAGLIFAQAQSFRHEYPQFRNLSALPGGGFGVMSDGRPSLWGALAISTPIGFSLRRGTGALTFGAASYSRGFNPVDVRSNTNHSNGSLSLVIGIPVPKGNLAISMMVLSVKRDNVYCVQWQIPTKSTRLGISLGVQDTAGGGASENEGAPGEKDSSTSYFIVGTYELWKGAYISGGLGTRRFAPGFGNFSANLCKGVKAVIEHDSYNWNYVLALDLGRFFIIKREIDVILSLGYIRRERQPYLALSFTF